MDPEGDGLSMLVPYVRPGLTAQEDGRGQSKQPDVLTYVPPTPFAAANLGRDRCDESADWTQY